MVRLTTLVLPISLITPGIRQYQYISLRMQLRIDERMLAISVSLLDHERRRADPFSYKRSRLGLVVRGADVLAQTDDDGPGVEVLVADGVGGDVLVPGGG